MSRPLPPEVDALPEELEELELAYERDDPKLFDLRDRLDTYDV